MIVSAENQNVTRSYHAGRFDATDSETSCRRDTKKKNEGRTYRNQRSVKRAVRALHGVFLFFCCFCSLRRAFLVVRSRSASGERTCVEKRIANTISAEYLRGSNRVTTVQRVCDNDDSGTVTRHRLILLTWLRVAFSVDAMPGGAATSDAVHLPRQSSWAPPIRC